MPDSDRASQPHQPALKFAVLVLAVAAAGFPVNHPAVYAVLVAAAVFIFTGEVRAQKRAWLAAAAIVAVATAAQILLAPPRLDEGHNVFLPGPALERALPGDVYRRMLSDFDAQYPPAVRCRPGSAGCWQNGGFPDSAFAFSADGIWHKSDYSRAVSGLDFSDPVWLRLGFVNDGYNWYTAAPDVHRADRERAFWMGLHRWHLAMPWYEAVRLPAAFAGGELCWRGELMWEGANEHFDALPGEGCRAITPADAGKRIFGIAIKPDTLAMHLSPPLRIYAQQVLAALLALAGIIGMLVMLVRVEPRRTVVPFVLIGLAVLVIAADDASFLGGVRPFDGGDDGLFYDHVGRAILQKFFSGDFYGAFEGGEKVFYYGGPGLRYFRALEHAVFGETCLGYLSLVLLLPFLAFRLFRRFLTAPWPLALTLIFIAIPVGEIFGTTFIDYAKWASRGFADPASYILFVAALTVLAGVAQRAPDDKFAPAFFASLLFAMSIFMRPLVVPAAAVMLAGAGLTALVRQQWRRVIGLCSGFIPVLSMALHNWVYGHVFVPLSANASHPQVLVMPPSAWLTAAREMLTFDFSGGFAARALAQIPQWLSGPADSYATVPLNAAGVAILIYVVVFGRRFDPWLRLIGGAALAQHAVALFYVATPRYYYLTWFLTMLVAMVFMQDIGLPWLRRRYPGVSDCVANHPLSLRLASGLARLQKSAA